MCLTLTMLFWQLEGEGLQCSLWACYTVREDVLSPANWVTWLEMVGQWKNRCLRKSIIEITGEETTAASTHNWCDPMLPIYLRNKWENDIWVCIINKNKKLKQCFFNLQIIPNWWVIIWWNNLPNKCWNVKVLKWFNVNIFSSAMQHLCSREHRTKW